MNRPFFDMSPSMLMWRTCSGELMANRVSRPPKPFSLVPIGTLCQALKFSMCIQDGQLVVYGQEWPDAFSFSAAATTSFQVLGGLFGSRPAFLKASLLT